MKKGEIRLADWPIIAEAAVVHERSGGGKMHTEYAWISVRRHADGRAIVCGGCDLEGLDNEKPVSFCDGYLLSEDDDAARAIRALAGRMARRLVLRSRGAHIAKCLARETIASLRAD